MPELVEEMAIMEQSCLHAARLALSKYWDYNKASCVSYQMRMKPSARQCLNKTMRSLENSARWNNESGLVFRRFASHHSSSTPERTMITRANRRSAEQSQQTQDNDALSDAMKLLKL
jgi:hypothetical protein